MPAKKTVTEAAVEEKKTTAKKTAAKKTAAKKTTTKKTAAATAEAKPATAKKTAAKKTTATKKTTTKKTTTKKTTKKETAKAEVVAEVVNKKSVKDYEDIINWKKGEAHAMDWLYIEVNAGDLLTEVEAGVDNLSATCNAILNCMLEGDGFINEPAEEDKVNASLTVRYYCDNLSQDRKKYFDR